MQDCRRGLPQRVRQRPHAWVPGELLVGAHVDMPGDADPGAVVATLRANVRKMLADIPVESPELDNDPPLLVPTGRDNQNLLFVHFRLGTADARVMRQAIRQLNQAAEPGSLGAGVQLIAATPNWFGAAQQDCAGGSPASYPAPVEVFGSRIRYAPDNAELDIHDVDGSVQVAVLDTAPDAVDIAWARQRFSANRQLHELLEHLASPIGGLEDPAFEGARRLAMQTLDAGGGFHPVEMSEPYDVREHGLFVASVVHAAAPWVGLRLVRVLNNYGAGSLHSLVVGLVGLVKRKPADSRLIINLSLGMLPPLEQLATMWFGFSVRGLPGCPEEPSLQFSEQHPGSGPEELRKLIEDGDELIEELIANLHRPLRELSSALLAQNCLILAAAGNDSVYRGTNRRPRWNPRLPAAYDSVLGVAADTVHRGEPARYSNRGEFRQADVRDAVATLGGDLAPDGVTPRAGVIGVYTAEQFPGTGVLNDSGWAEWSGTSFATPIMAGIAANVWSSQPGLDARRVLDKLNDAARPSGTPEVEVEVEGLDVPGVPVRLIWLS